MKIKVNFDDGKDDIELNCIPEKKARIKYEGNEYEVKDIIHEITENREHLIRIEVKKAPIRIPSISTPLRM
ncbi:TPA: hypothetical protein QD007_003635 [Shewanella algae]|uniref:hypothetical protein n=1 Tax=Shewanella algae TaxID=38313 RepID=UPI001C5A1F0D|nr:hypothetical protein [Shewanella algae]HDS1213011.1 hypothetical protein [Shewanella algae]